MARKIRNTKRNNIVIVCEGKDTEPSYLEDLKKDIKEYFDEIRIVPIDTEAKNASVRDGILKKNSRKSRTMNAPITRLSGKFYWVKEEVDENTYEKYKQQPTRYVREAQLFLEDGFVEAWAVYDYDKFPDHENARILADSDPNLNIAFSSMSFEEWLLLHFERNDKAFLRSCCKEGKKDIGCGDHTTNHKNDCHGQYCIAGYLRENNFIPDFAKSNTDLFSKYTTKRLNLARVNAAWIRSLSTDKAVYERNPYTDFDRLLEKLLCLNDQYIWIGNVTNFCIEKCEISISRNTASGEIILKNESESTFISNWNHLDDFANPIGEKGKIILSNGECTTIKFENYPYIMIGDDFRKYIITFN